MSGWASRVFSFTCLAGDGRGGRPRPPVRHEGHCESPAVAVGASLTGAPEVRGDPPYPDVQYLFRVEGETELRLGSAWRFGRLGVESEAEAETLAARLRDESIDGGHVVHYVPGDPSRNAVSTDHGGVLSRAPVVASAVVLVLGAALAALFESPAVAGPVWVQEVRLHYIAVTPAALGAPKLTALLHQQALLATALEQTAGWRGPST